MKVSPLILALGLLATSGIPVDAKIVYNNDTED